jgi:hypothetical protein
MGKIKNILKKMRSLLLVDDDDTKDQGEDQEDDEGDDQEEELDSRTVTFGNPSHEDESDMKLSLKQPKHPADKTYFEICSQSYNKRNKRPYVIRNYWKYLKNYSTDTVCVYVDKANKVIVLCYRGTIPTYLPDLVADKNIAFNKLSETNRFKDDAETTEKLLEDFTTNDFSYFMCGHSLGQAMFLEMDRVFDKFSFGGRGYNGALQPKDIIFNPKKFRYWYIKGDPLYRLSGRFLQRSLLVFPQASQKTLQNHDLANFKGLTKQDAIKKGGGSSTSAAKLSPPTNMELNSIGFPSNIQKQYR